MKIIIKGKPKPLMRPYYSKSGIFDRSKQDKNNFSLQCKIYAPKLPYEGVISLDLEFYFERPKSHFRSGKNSELLKKGCTRYHKNTPDLSNLIKFVEDALFGRRIFVKLNNIIVLGHLQYTFDHDRQVVIINAVKYYCNKKYKEPQTTIGIREYA